MTITARTKSLYATAAAASRPVWIFIACETLLALVVLVVSWALALRLTGTVALDQLPPWQALGGWFLLGATAHAVRAARPIEALRRWHGVAERRIDERWGDDR
jgi:hypothetical protein